jgi:quinol monooxygenase YgiN
MASEAEIALSRGWFICTQAFLLVITHEYKSIRDRDVFIELFTPLAKFVQQHEPDTLAYELSISDKDPHKIIIFER